MAEYRDITGAVRAAITSALAPTGITVLPWPGDTQALPVPCWCVGVPSHNPADRSIPDTVCRDPWSMQWPLVLYVTQTNDRTSTDLIDTQVGLLVEALRADDSLGGLLDDSEVISVRHALSRDDRTPRVHEVTAVLETLIDQARP